MPGVSAAISFRAWSSIEIAARIGQALEHALIHRSALHASAPWKRIDWPIGVGQDAKQLARLLQIENEIAWLRAAALRLR